jgi:3-isopropylmalate/(R)-2-methylmalate dehydratase small subunit
MRKVVTVVGTAVVIDRDNIDTDQIIPSRYLKKITRTGYAEGLFAEWRKDPAFPLNDPTRREASILITGANFGCGSSREHAAWALDEWGFRAVMATSFADIFRANAVKTGLVPVLVAPDGLRRLAAIAADPGAEIRVDLARRSVSAGGLSERFEIAEFERTRLLAGLDDVGVTLRHAEAIQRYEADVLGRG